MLINTQLLKSFSTTFIEFKVVVLGKENTGKTSLVEKYLYERFCDAASYQSTIGTAFGAKRMVIDGHSISLGIWDTAGSERYDSMSRIYYRGAFAAIICFDLTNASTFEKAAFWINEIKQCEEKCKIYLCGTKKDLIKQDKTNRRVDYYDALELADENAAQYYETSSKDGDSIDEMFLDVSKAFVADPENLKINKRKGLSLNGNSTASSSNTCNYSKKYNNKFCGC
ncbi:unnamed protein product [Gordionus sp. m RMFG-2023]|uniref:ras-related protein Rab-24-like isoform X1 n=1 Tax=Gordionus sp. m RMFG-2023 TaxID=3053472 RepID=UPI0030E2C067